MKLNFSETGNGENLVLLHAFPLSNEMWQPQIEFFAEEGFRVITPDHRGFGESANFSDILTMEEMANDLVEMLDLLEIENAVFGGLSMGGYVLFEFAKNAGERISSLVFCDTNSSSDTEEKKNNRYDLIKKIEKDGSDALIENMLPNLICESTKKNNTELVLKIEEMFRKTAPESAIAALRGMAVRNDSDNFLPSISVPTAFVVGSEDITTPPDISRKMHALTPGSEYIEIANAGHYSNLEQPIEFNAAILNFLRSR
ncbi:MAG: alpha/beta fold hydrolase [Pyrinomonadaceae bacterium]|nr:alpha/beta fold hydrolase [Pyrinomonadaceae bacterium]